MGSIIATGGGVEGPDGRTEGRKDGRKEGRKEGRKDVKQWQGAFVSPPIGLNRGRNDREEGGKGSRRVRFLKPPQRM